MDQSLASPWVKSRRAAQPFHFKCRGGRLANRVAAAAAFRGEMDAEKVKAPCGNALLVADRQHWQQISVLMKPPTQLCVSWSQNDSFLLSPSPIYHCKKNTPHYITYCVFFSSFFSVRKTGIKFNCFFLSLSEKIWDETQRNRFVRITADAWRLGTPCGVGHRLVTHVAQVAYPCYGPSALEDRLLARQLKLSTCVWAHTSSSLTFGIFIKRPQLLSGGAS